MNASFWNSPTGQHVLSLERALLAEHIRRFHGDTVLWAGTDPASAVCMGDCMVRNAVFLDLSEPDQEYIPINPAAPVNQCVSELENLPFKSGSVDGVLLHHGLETAADPRTALREVTRVLAPGGRLILVGFNPMSLFGLRSLYSRLTRDSLHGYSLIHPLRLFDWLAVLGFELQHKPLYAAHGLPFTGAFNSLSDQRGASHRPVQEVQKSAPEIPAELSPELATQTAAEQSRLQRLHELRRRAFSRMRATLLGPFGLGPFGGLLIITATKQSSAASMQWRSPGRARSLAPVAYPRVAQWQLTNRK